MRLIETLRVLLLGGMFAAAGQAAGIAEDGGAGEAKGGDAPAAAPSGPQFKDDKSRESWESGKAAFEKGDLATAKKELTAASRGVENKESREIVSHWLTALKYAPYVSRMKDSMEKKQYGMAYEMYGQLYPRLYGTPAQTELLTLAQQLDQLLFHTVENFDYRKPDYTEKYGKFFINDRQYILRGTGCLRWQNTKDLAAGVLKVRTVPRSWKEFDAVEFWVRVLSPQPVQADLVIVCDQELASKKGAGPRPPAAPKGAALISCFNHSTRLAGSQWTRVFVKLKDFKPNLAPDLGAVQDFRIQIPKGRTYDLLIDEIRLMRKDPEPEGAQRQGRR